MTVGDQRRPGRQVGGDRGQLGGVGDRPQPVPDAVRGHWPRASGGRSAATSVTIRVAALGPEPPVPARRRTAGRSAPGWPGSPPSAPAARPPGPAPRPRAAGRCRPRAGPAAPRRSGRAAAGPAGRPAPAVNCSYTYSAGSASGTRIPSASHCRRSAAASVPGAARLARRMPGPDDPDDVVRVGGQQLVLVLAGDHVVRWRGDLGEPAYPVLGVTDAPERRRGRGRCAPRSDGRWPDGRICTYVRRIRRRPRFPPGAARFALIGNLRIQRLGHQAAMPTQLYQRGLEPARARQRGGGGPAARARRGRRAAVPQRPGGPGPGPVRRGLVRRRRGQLPPHRRGQPERRLRPVRPRPGPGPHRRPGRGRRAPGPGRRHAPQPAPLHRGPAQRPCDTERPEPPAQGGIPD